MSHRQVFSSACGTSVICIDRRNDADTADCCTPDVT
jgi:hypothetical protein